MRHLLITVIGLLLVLTMYNAEAADRWTIELRPGIAYATQDVGDENLNLGIGIEGTVSYRFLPHLAVYGGWDWHHFSTEENEFGESPDVEDTGYAFGLNFIHPLGNSRFSYLVRLGGLYNHIEIESGSGDIVFDSGHGLGWEAGIGLVYSLNDRWRLSPGVRYRSLSRDIELQNMTVPADLTYFSIDVGVSIAF